MVREIKNVIYECSQCGNQDDIKHKVDSNGQEYQECPKCGHNNRPSSVPAAFQYPADIVPHTKDF